MSFKNLFNKESSTSVDVECVSEPAESISTEKIKLHGDFHDRLDVEKHGETQRRITPRHVSLMIIGQSIGSGLFLGVRTPLNTSGSLSFFLAFTIWAVFVVYPLMQVVGVICCYLPIKGSFIHYSARYVDPALGFASSIIYIYTCMMFVCLEATAVAQVIGFWTDVNPGAWITICIVIYPLIGIFGSNIYGEVEFYSSILKLFMVMGLMLFSLVSMCGGNPRHDAYGFQHWKEGGLFREYLVDGSTGKFLAWWSSLLWAAFAAGGPDGLAMLAGEIKRPRTTMANAAKRTYIRVYIFYIGGMFFLCCLVSSVNPKLVAQLLEGSNSSAGSPWVIGIEDVGVKGLASVINAGIMMSAFSCGNAFFYCSARSIYSAALGGYLPRFLAKCLPNGAPIYCVLITFAVSLISYLNVNESGAVVFNWFVNLCATGLLLTYTCIWWSYFQFRKDWEFKHKQKMKHPEYPYFLCPQWMHPIFTYLGLALTVLVVFFNGFWIFFPGQFNVSNLFTSYFAPVFFVCLFVFWKVVKRTHFRTAKTADITSGKQRIDDEEEAEEKEIREQEFVFYQNAKWYHKAWQKFYAFWFT